MTIERIVDSLSYSCYKHNRQLSPNVKPEEWQPCFNAPVGPMEAKYQAELGQRMNDLLERMHRNLNGEPSAASKQFEVDREKEAMNPRVVYGSEDDSEA